MQKDKQLTPKLVTAIISAGIMAFAGVVAETAMNITFPTLMREFGIGTAAVQWLTTGYLLMLAIIVPASGWLKNNFSHKRLFIAAEAFFITGTVLCCAAPSFALLLTGRIVQGLGTGIALPLMFNLVLEEVPAQKTGFMMGVACMITAMAPVVGPFAGGLIITLWGWRLIFVFMLPLLLLSLIAGLLTVPANPQLKHTRFEWSNYLLMAVGFALFITATAHTQAGWLSAAVTVPLFISAVLLALFYRRSLTSPTPVINVKIFRSGRFNSGAAAMVFIYFTVLGLGFLIPNYAQLVFGADAFTAGCLLLPGCILGILVTPSAGRVLDHCGAALPVLGGSILMLGSVSAMAWLTPDISNTLFAVLYTFFAFGQAASIPTVTLCTIRCLSADDSASGNAVINTLQPLSGALGTSICASIVAAAQNTSAGAAGTQTGTAHALVLLAVFTAVILFCNLYLLNGKSHTVNTPNLFVSF